MQTQLKLKLKLTALFLCFFLTLSLSDADEDNQLETLERLLRDASNTLVTFLEEEILTTQQHDAISVWNKLIETSVARLEFSHMFVILGIVNKISDTLPLLNLPNQTQTITDFEKKINQTLALIRDEISKLKARPISKN